MLGEYEAERQHLLAMVEAAQRAGRSEREIVDIVERYFGQEATRRLGIGGEPGLARRLLSRATVKRAA